MKEETEVETIGMLTSADVPPNEARRPLRVLRTGRPRGSGAQPPLHLIYMVKVGWPNCRKSELEVVSFNTSLERNSPMDITGASPGRFELGIRLFLEGQAVLYNEVVFWKDGDKALHVNSYSDWNCENTTPDMARQKIERSKAVLEELSEKSNEFSEVANRLPHAHYFCHDCGNAGIVLAKDLNGEFTWLC